MVILGPMIYVCIYFLEMPFFEKYKVCDEPWPWKVDKGKWKSLLRESLLLLSVNYGVISPIFSFINYVVGIPVSFDFSIEGLPSAPKFFAQLVFCAVFEDLWFHFSHRLMHTKWLYENVHKLHHKHIQTVFYSTNTQHPLDFTLVSAIAMFVGGQILGKHMHIMSFIGWCIVRELEGLDAHCGYEFSWSPYRWLPFATSHGYHAFHHLNSVGNYSSFFHIWDTVFGTNKAYDHFLAGL